MKYDLEWFEERMFSSNPGTLGQLVQEMNGTMRESAEVQRMFIIAYWKYLTRVNTDDKHKEWSAWIRCYENLTWMIGTQDFGTSTYEFEENLKKVDRSVRKVLGH